MWKIIKNMVNKHIFRKKNFGKILTRPRAQTERDHQKISADILSVGDEESIGI